MKEITILVPCYNEAKTLPSFLSAVHEITATMPQYKWNFLFINDGSQDNTLNVIKDMRMGGGVEYISLSRNFGKEAAMLAGFDYVEGDAVIIMDADLQDPPVVIPQLVARWEEGYEDVYAMRRSRGKESWLRKKLSMAYYHLLSKTSTIDVLPNVGDFRLLDKKCIAALKQLRETNRYTKGMFCYIGFKKCCVEFDRGDRVAGRSNMSWRKLFHLAIDGLMSYTTTPLHLSVWVGFIVSIGALIYMVYVFVKTLIYGDPVAGYPSMIVIILFLGGIQLLSIGIIGEYLGKVYSETKNRPTYFVAENSKIE